MVQSLLAYDIREVLLSNIFFSRILDAKKIVETAVYFNEAYFIVYGDQQKFHINKVSQERPKSWESEPHEYYLYYPEEYSDDDKYCGRWIPNAIDEGHRFIIADVQFKNLNSIAIPSVEDMRRAYGSALHNRVFFYWADEYFQTLHFICDCRASKATSLIFQCTDKLVNTFDDDGAVFGIKEGFREMYGDGYQSLNFEDEELPFKMEEYLNSGGLFRAKVIRFNNWIEYIEEMLKLKDFLLVAHHAKQS